MKRVVMIGIAPNLNRCSLYRGILSVGKFLIIFCQIWVKILRIIKNLHEKKFKHKTKIASKLLTIFVDAP